MSSRRVLILPAILVLLSAAVIVVGFILFRTPLDPPLDISAEGEAAAPDEQPQAAEPDEQPEAATPDEQPQATEPEAAQEEPVSMFAEGAASTRLASIDAPVTILWIGVDIDYDDPSGETEAMYMMTVDPAATAVTIDAFPGSLVVDVEGLEGFGISQIELKHVYRYGLQLYGDDTVAATSLLAQTIDDNFGFVPDHYVTAYQSSFAAIVDVLGGIDVNMPADFEAFDAGVHHLDGDETVHYLTSMTNPGIPTETARMTRHQAVLAALRDKVLSPGIFQALPGLWQVFATSEVIQTDLSPQQLLDLVVLLEEIPVSQVTFNVHVEA